MSRTLAVAAAMIAAGSLLNACGGGANSSQSNAGASTASGDTGAGSPPTGATSTGSAATDCSYISPAQISSIEGAKYAAPTIFGSICNWIGSDGNSLSISLTRNANEAAWQEVLGTIDVDQQHADRTPIPGLGDRAVGIGLEIAVQHGATIIDIREGDSPGFGKWPKSTALANAIIAGLH